MEIDGKQVMSVKAYAEKIGGKVSTIRKMCADCVLPSVKIGVPWFVFVDEADEYYRQQWLNRKAAADEQKRRRTLRKPQARVKGSTFAEMLAKMKQEVMAQ